MTISWMTWLDSKDYRWTIKVIGWRSATSPASTNERTIYWHHPTSKSFLPHTVKSLKTYIFDTVENG